MPTIERRTIEELAARYDLEPTLRDVYVEGHTDALFFDWFLRKSSASNAVVYEIDSVDVDAQTVLKHGLEVGNRGRLIAFSLEIDPRLGDPRQVTCIADTDYDAVLRRQYKARILLLTDYTSLELYSFNETTLAKFLALVARTVPEPPGNLLNKFRPILHEVFFIRLANVLLGLKASWIQFVRCCEYHRGELRFDSAEYLTRYINSNNLHSMRETIGRRLVDLRRIDTAEPRHFIRGHDYVTLMAFYLKKCTGDSLFTDEMVERSLLSCVEHEELLKERMFQQLLSRVQS